jgi:hypothetical protein
MVDEQGLSHVAVSFSVAVSTSGIGLHCNYLTHCYAISFTRLCARYEIGLGSQCGSHAAGGSHPTFRPLICQTVETALSFLVDGGSSSLASLELRHSRL